MIQARVLSKHNEKELEAELNDFLETIKNMEIVDIKYNVAVSQIPGDRTEVYSALVLYRK